MCRLEGASFYFYYKPFSPGQSLTLDVEKYDIVEKELLVKFAKNSRPEEEVNESVAAELDVRDMGRSLARKKYPL